MKQVILSGGPMGDAVVDWNAPADGDEVTVDGARYRYDAQTGQGIFAGMAG